MRLKTQPTRMFFLSYMNILFELIILEVCCLLNLIVAIDIDVAYLYALIVAFILLLPNYQLILQMRSRYILEANIRKLTDPQEVYINIPII